MLVGVHKKQLKNNYLLTLIRLFEGEVILPRTLRQRATKMMFFHFVGKKGRELFREIRTMSGLVRPTEKVPKRYATNDSELYR